MDEETMEWLSRFLKPDIMSKLQQVSVRLSPTREIGLVDLLVSWYQHVKKMENDLPLTDADRTVWGAYDLVAALSLRDFLGGALEQLESRDATAVAAAVKDTDERFRSFTEDDGSQRVQRLDESAGEDRGWWWGRIPARGPIRREIEAISAQAAD